MFSLLLHSALCGLCILCLWGWTEIKTLSPRINWSESLKLKQEIFNHNLSFLLFSVCFQEIWWNRTKSAIDTSLTQTIRFWMSSEIINSVCRKKIRFYKPYLWYSFSCGAFILPLISRVISSKWVQLWMSVMRAGACPLLSIPSSCWPISSVSFLCKLWGLFEQWSSPICELLKCTLFKDGYWLRFTHGPLNFDESDMTEEKMSCSNLIAQKKKIPNIT